MDRQLLTADEGDLELVAPEMKDRLLDGRHRLATLRDVDGPVRMRRERRRDVIQRLAAEVLEDMGAAQAEERAIDFERVVALAVFDPGIARQRDQLLVEDIDQRLALGCR